MLFGNLISFIIQSSFCLLVYISYHILVTYSLIFILIFYQLAVGPVAIVSLLTGTLIAKWQPDYATNKVGAMDTAAQASLCTGIVSISSRRKFYKRCCIVFLITPLPFLFSYHFLLFSFFNVFFFTLFLLFSSFLLSYCFLLFSFITPFFLLSDLIGHGTVEYGEFYSFYLTSRYVLVNKFFLQIFSLFVFSYLPM